jgi:hypothetical protein
MATATIPGTTSGPGKRASVDQTDQLLPGWSVIRKLARYVSQNSQGQLDFRKSDRLIACRCVRLAAAVASAAGRAAGTEIPSPEPRRDRLQ